MTDTSGKQELFSKRGWFGVKLGIIGYGITTVMQFTDYGIYGLLGIPLMGYSAYILIGELNGRKTKAVK